MLDINKPSSEVVIRDGYCLFTGPQVNYSFGARLYNYYRRDTEPLKHSFLYSLVSLLSGIYPFLAMQLLLVTIK